MAVKKEKLVTEETRYALKQLQRSDKYSDKQDLLGALLEKEKLYTLQEVEDKLNIFLKGKVK